MTLLDMVRDYQSLLERKEELADEVKANNALIEEAKANISQQMIDDDCPSISVGGFKFTLTPKTIYNKFLSTPSARRATAKTERKYSAFVSLYTSLHKLQRGVCKASRKITPLLAQSAVIPVRSIPENHVHCLFALAGHQKISTLSCANSGCSPTCSTLVW